MQTTLEKRDWFTASRLKGVFRYHRARMGRTLLWVLVILLSADVLSLLMGLFTLGKYEGLGVSANISITLLSTLICACVAADGGTRFLLRFGTPRTSVWLGSVLSLIGWMAALLLCTLLLSTGASALLVLLHSANPGMFSLISYYDPSLNSAQVFSQTLSEALAALPNQLLWTLEWSCLFYLLGCCLRRSKAITVSVLIGVPLILFLTMLIPTVQQTVAALESASEGELVVMGVKWLKWLSGAIRWVERQWPWIQLCAALASLPLSYLCMRGTQQP